MKTFSIIAIALSATLAFSTTSALAASTDFTDHGTYTSDGLSGLDWLDVTSSINQSYNYVSGQFGIGGDYEGWRYASGSEFTQLYNNYTSHNYSTQYNLDLELARGEIDGLIALLGDTFLSHLNHGIHRHRPYPTNYNPNSTFIQYTLGILADTKPLAYSAHYLAMIANLGNSRHRYRFRYRDNEDTVKTHYTYASDKSARYHYGSYLVRGSLIATPIPAAVFLFAPALLGLLGFRRKVRA